MSTTRPDPAPRFGALTLVLLRLLGQGAEFVGWALIARHLRPEAFGRLAVAYLVCRFLGVGADWGASVRGARDVAAQDHDLVVTLVRRRERLTFLTTVGFAAVCLTVREPLLALLAATVASRSLNRDWIALGRERSARSAAPPLLQGGVIAVGALGVHRLEGAVALITIASLASLLASILLNRVDRGEPSRGRVDGWIVSAALGDQLLISADTVLLGVLRSSRDAGIYAAIYRLPNAWLAVAGLVSVAVVPRMTIAARSSPSRGRVEAENGIRVGRWAALLVAVAAPIAGLLVPAILGGAYRSGRGPAVILVLAAAVATLNVAYHPVLLANGEDRLIGQATLALAATNVIANVLLIPRFGMIGAALVTLSTQVCGVTVMHVRWQRLRDRLDGSATGSTDDGAGRPPEDRQVEP